MTRLPTGRLLPAANGTDLVISRTFRASIEDVWASVTESERTARWYGPWQGDAAPGRTIKVQMAYEDQAPWFDMVIEVCEPPRRLVVATTEESGTIRIELLLSHADGTTELRLVHHLDSPDGVGDWGPGWEYYLDMLVAARDGTPQPIFDDHLAAMKPYYEALRAQGLP